MEAAGGVDVGGPAPAAPRVPRATSGTPKVTREVPIVFGPGEKEKHLATADRLSQIRNGLGLDVDDAGQIIPDNAKSLGLTEGHDPDAMRVHMRRFGQEARKGETAKTGSERGAIGDLILGEKDYDPYREFKGGIFSDPQDEKLNDAQNMWGLTTQLLGHREEGKLSEDPSAYMFARDAGDETKAATRGRLADKITQEANTLPDAAGGAALKDKYRKIAEYIRTLNPDMLHGAAKAAAVVSDLTRHASPPVQAAVKHAIRTTMLDAFKVGFGNNVAPMTMGLGSMIATAAAPGDEPVSTGGDMLDPAALAPPARGSVGADVDMMHQRIVQNMSGMPPEDQAKYIQRLKDEHPGVYRVGAALGWFADPVGLLGGKLIGGAAKAGGSLAEAVGAPALAGKALGAGVAGAPQGMLADAANGGAGGVTPALVGAAGGAAGEVANAAIGKIGAAMAGAPKRLEIRDLVTGANAINHDVIQAVHRGDEAAPANMWKEVYRRLNASLERSQRANLTLNPTTGRFRELEHAVDVATKDTHSAGSGQMTSSHPYAALVNPGAPAINQAGAIVHAAAERRLTGAAMLWASTRAKAGAGAIDTGIAKLVSAIRTADPHGFRFALREAREAGVSHEMIQAAEEAYHKRNHERVSP